MTYRRAILIRIPRTASGSSGEMLGVKDENHIPAKDLKKQMGTKWEQYYKFAFVRNPYTRFQSCYIATGADQEFGDINEVLKHKMFPELMKKHPVFFRPQVDYVTDENGKVMIDFIGRFEDLYNGWRNVFRMLGKSRPKISHRHKSEKDLPELTPASKDILYEIYRDDFEKFDYER